MQMLPASEVEISRHRRRRHQMPRTKGVSRRAGEKAQKSGTHVAERPRRPASRARLRRQRTAIARCTRRATATLSGRRDGREATPSPRSRGSRSTVAEAVRSKNAAGNTAHREAREDVGGQGDRPNMRRLRSHGHVGRYSSTRPTYQAGTPLRFHQECLTVWHTERVKAREIPSC